MKKNCLVLLSILFVFLMIGCDFTTAKLEDVQTAKSIDYETNLPTEVARVFNVNSPVVYVTGTLKNAPENTVISIEWIYLDMDPEYLIAEVELKAEHTNVDFFFELTKPNNGWPLGDYECRLYIDGDYQENVFFTVE